MSNEKIHPAIVDLRKFLHQKGDINLLAFMQRWMAEWLEVVDCEAPLVQDASAAYAANIDRRAFEKIGIKLGEECVVKVTDETTHSYAIVAFRANKKLVLAGS